MIEIRNISKNFKGVQALKNVSTIFYDGEIHGYVGENGAGKSTLMKIISGVYHSDTGDILIDGQTIIFNNPVEAYNSGIRIVHQDLSLIPSLSVAENIFIHKYRSASIRKIVNRKAIEEDTKKILQEWDIDVDPRTLISELSTGIKQLIEIARELYTKCRIIILDEPTSSLSEKEIKRFFKVLMSLKSKGIIVIFISHRISEVIELADRVTVLRDGEVISTKKAEEFTLGQICNLIAGKDIKELYPKTTAPIGDVAIKIEDLSGERFRNISFQIKWGEIVGLSGLMGAGKTELLRAVFGIDKIKKGKIIFEGSEIQDLTPNKKAKKGIVMLTEDRVKEGIFPELSVSKNMVMIKIKEIMSGIFLDFEKIYQKCKVLVDRLNIVTYNSDVQVISQLSGGNQQKAIIGRLLFSKPKVLLLDEPTRGVDVGSKTEIHNIMGQFIKEGGTILIASSEVDELLGICDNVVVLHEGNFIKTFQRKELNKEALIKCMINI
jgi:ABC-type sugar transport system ATPase subunit